ncbi:MAG: 1,6-anhydro-N-acetylmuramyl-L-alanine amidase AmpD [Gammaproteobacteria bacterium]|nr:1,6-anhydro-N-acetylmuramyl-L-alanine amidase AmpD [Gammaproteobacteria bacterium]
MSEPEDGLLDGAHQCPSPNHDKRPEVCPVDLLVIHNISLPPKKFGGPWIEDFFLNRLDPTEDEYFAGIYQSKVSAHLLVRRDGELVQFVPLNQRAWHAGASSFKGRPNCNDHSIGIELEGADNILYTKAQYKTLTQVTLDIMAIYPSITPERITGHSDIAPGRKTDPGPAFDWPRYLNSLNPTPRNA